MSNPEDDQAIIDLVLSGDADSYAKIVTKYQAKLIRYVTYLIKEPQLAQDIVQRTFIKAYQALNSYNPDYKFSSWLYRIAHNQAMNSIKKHNRTSTIDLRPIKNLFSSDTPDPEEKLEIKDIKRRIHDSLDQLSPDHKAVLSLYYLEDQSYQDIADILKIPINTVSSRIHRAKAALKQVLRSTS